MPPCRPSRTPSTVLFRRSSSSFVPSFLIFHGSASSCLVIAPLFPVGCPRASSSFSFLPSSSPAVLCHPVLSLSSRVSVFGHHCHVGPPFTSCTSALVIILLIFRSSLVIMIPLSHSPIVIMVPLSRAAIVIMLDHTPARP